MTYEVALNGVDAFAQAFWERAGSAKVFAFHGQMGAGKTTLIAALCRALGVHDAIGSPTFAIINEYAGGNGQPIFHIDLYRLNNAEEIMQTGVEDTLTSGEICLVEWPGKAPQLFDEATVHVYVTVAENGSRIVEMKDSGF